MNHKIKIHHEHLSGRLNQTRDPPVDKNVLPAEARLPSTKNV